MSSFSTYLIQSSIVFSILYLLYWILYSRTTFYRLNRYILLIIPILAIIAPFSYALAPKISSSVILIPEFNHFVADGKEIITHTLDKVDSESFNFIELCFYAYLVVVTILFIRMVLSIKLIFDVKDQSISKIEDGFCFVYINEPNTFSFFNWIFISKEQHTKDYTLIIEHEKAHAQLKHSLDVFFSEVYMLFFWFNPLVYSYRKSLKSIHEYQADTWVLNKKVKKSAYLYALLENITFQPSNNLYNYFNQSVIKKRIDMITKNPTKRMYKLSYSLLIVCAIALCFAFTKPIKAKDLVQNLSYGTLHSTHPPFLFPVKNKSRNDISSVYGQKGRFSKKTSKKIHQGVDIKAPTGTPIIASADGVIMKASNQKAWGNLIVINHADGYQTWYAHLDSFKIKEKQTVTKGEVIGYVGNTGLSTGPHLHFEVRLNDKHLDPLDLIED
ncbi:peptidoglycan DD-metalloendopeptidase family protein [uncultured Tenacibaculum sp.]|uniref:peptidoglycan DD-metalloendopeptidase family protein n=1 Tax=uncultured Tenacibaculum sp. TaxID=174713 RepID=UPI00261DD07D|nr:peptidoglycan DD-metalloendopeptidase family protein [uncultured Tenacibaculum sp.]